MRGLPIFWQTLILMFASVIVTQAVSIGMFFALPPPRPDFNRLSDITDSLTGGTGERDRDRGNRERALIRRIEPAPPRPGPGLISYPELTARMAGQLHVRPDQVRLFFEPDSWVNWPTERRKGPVPIRRGEPIFFNTVVAGVQTPAGWSVARTQPRPWFGPYQRRSLLWFALSALLLLPAAWFFARRITRPIRSFADAADRLGADPSAPSVPEQGPTELRTTAHALNRMQRRLGEYVQERTAMIGAIAHDLRTPLARIAFRIEAAPDPIRDKVLADIEQMRAMIAATIGFVKGTTLEGVRQPVELAALIGDMVAAEREMGRDVRIEAAAPVTIDGDPVGLERLFQNLIDNGVTYGRAVRATVAREGAAAVVRISDDGPGLPPHELGRMFQPFERGDKSRNPATGGVGLGLTIARSIAEAHGGTLDLRNRAEGGLEAECRFPLAG